MADHIVCEDCDEVSVSFNLAAIMRDIARVVATSSHTMTPKELVFMRKYLGMRQRDLGAVLGLTQESLSRCETGAAPLSATRERLLRAIVIAKATGRDDILAIILGDEVSDPLPAEQHRFSLLVPA